MDRDVVPGEMDMKTTCHGFHECKVIAENDSVWVTVASYRYADLYSSQGV